MPAIDDFVDKQLQSICQRIRGRRKTRQNKRAFLRSLFICNCRVIAAAAAVEVAARTVYHWRQVDPLFAEAWDDVQALFHARLEQLVIEEAEQGNDKMLALAVRKLVPEFADVPSVQINNTHVLHPEKSEAEKLKRAREVMEAIGIAISEDATEAEDS